MLTVAALAALVITATASAHARVSPAVSLSGKLQLYSLAVPTEKENLTTTTIVLTVPAGFGIDSFVPAPGWTQRVQATGSGDNAVVQKVTWTGGSTPTGDDSLFQFLAQPAKSGTYTFSVQQTYSDGSIVNWSGPESADAPAPAIEAVSSIGGGGTRPSGSSRSPSARSRSSSPARGCSAAVEAEGRASSHDAGRRGIVALAVAAGALVAPAAASAHAYLVQTVPSQSQILKGLARARSSSPTTRRSSRASRRSRSPTPTATS